MSRDRRAWQQQAGGYGECRRTGQPLYRIGCYAFHHYLLAHMAVAVHD